MPEILFRWNYYTTSWEVYSYSLQSWQPSESLRDEMTEEEVRAHFLKYGHEARKRTPVTYAQGEADAKRMLGSVADHNEDAFNN